MAAGVVATTISKRITAGATADNSKRIIAAVSLDIAKRITAAATQDITARVNRTGTESTYDPWAASWGTSWGGTVFPPSWLVSLGASGLGHTARVTAAAIAANTKRVTDAVV